MKILAVDTSRETVVLEATFDELWKLIGYRGRYDVRLEKRGGRRSLRADQTINVAAMYDHLSTLAQSSAGLRATAAKLRTAADLIDTLPEPLTEVKADPDPES